MDHLPTIARITSSVVDSGGVGVEGCESSVWDSQSMKENESQLETSTRYEVGLA